MPMIALLIKMSSVKAWGVRHHRTCSRPSGTGRVLAVTSGKSGLLNHPPEVSAAGPGMGAGRELKSQKQTGGSCRAVICPRLPLGQLPHSEHRLRLRGLLEDVTGWQPASCWSRDHFMLYEADYQAEFLWVKWQNINILEQAA